MQKDLFGNSTMVISDSFKMICVNCMDFDADKNVCTIRYLIHKDGTKSPMPRKPNQKGCKVFMQK